ncbi:S9 family peptidase [Chitinimonas sp. BJB300]|uniref:S9 family peptidase n=1 Tax=Chitinimonas sp. BJB300 TaxID=1559339 RepID=UPI000C0D3CD7|nr:S9 family peptidase [Chitinimonas sp. BJB300]PHV11681.1 oligopeptidase B [Chitinimonas sp. BJB300]TSJ85928.1 S9 family peptidase [Chitinimonas sp. BJB300]
MAANKKTVLSASKPTTPIATKQPQFRFLHGDARDDDYRWLHDKDNVETITYLQAENSYAEAMTADLKPFETSLFEEMKARIKEDDSSVPYKLDGYYYYSRFEASREYPLLCRKPIDANGGWADSPEQVLLDINVLAKGKTFMEVGEFEVSPDGHMLAFSTDATGFRQYKLQIKDLRSGKLLPFKRDRVTSAAWALDSRTLFYSTEDKQTKRSNQLWRHTLGESVDKLVHEEKDERFGLDVYLTRSNGYLIEQIGSLTSSEIRYLKADEPNGRWRVLARRRAQIEYNVDHRADAFYLRINDTGRNFRLVTAPITNPGRENWLEVLPAREDVMLEGIDLFQHFMVQYERVNGLNQLVITDLRTQATHGMAFSEPVYSLGVEANAEWDTEVYRYSYESMTTPSTVYDYHMATRTQTLLKRRPVLGDFDPVNYMTERIWATARDGVPVPISLVYRKGKVCNGSSPLWLDAYGAYGIPNDVYFSSSRLSLLDRGVTFAVAHIRGGGDLGKTWHDAGRMQHKINSFTDFIACAEHLITKGYTSSDRLVIEGGSAGGLLMGAVSNMRPDLFKIVVSQVPFVDVLSTMLDASLPLTVGEYEEWGNPNKKTEYHWMRAYSPYDNLSAQSYPTMLVKTSLNDSQVMFWEPAKYVAKLRTLKTDQNPLLLMTNMGAGHGGASGRFDRLKEIAFDYAFVLRELGLN